MLAFIAKYTTELISASGAIGSLLGALFAWKQYKKASLSAKKASSIEQRLITRIKRKDMVREVQNIRAIVEKLSKYIKPGHKYSELGLTLQNDIDNVTQFRNHLKSSSDYSETFQQELDEILKFVTSTNFNDANEYDRISAITGIIETLNNISSKIDYEANKHE